MTYKVLIIGLGAVGMGYDFDTEILVSATHARAFANHPDFELSEGLTLILSLYEISATAARLAVTFLKLSA